MMPARSGLLKTSILALAGLSAAGAATAQGTRACGPRADVLARLEGRFGETRQSVGLAANQSMLEVYASEDTGTWTILMTTPAGVTCLMASGQAWQPWQVAKVPEGDPA